MLPISSAIILSSCSGSGGGSAPSESPSPTPPSELPISGNYNAHLKNSETIVTTNNWTVTNDNSDSIEQKTLPNGWTIEVKYE